MPRAGPAQASARARGRPGAASCLRQLGRDRAVRCMVTAPPVQASMPQLRIAIPATTLQCAERACRLGCGVGPSPWPGLHGAHCGRWLAVSGIIPLSSSGVLGRGYAATGCRRLWDSGADGMGWSGKTWTATCSLVGVQSTIAPSSLPLRWWTLTHLRLS